MQLNRAFKVCLPAAALGLAMAMQASAAITAPVYVDFGTGDNTHAGDLGLLAGAPAPHNANQWNSIWHIAGDTINMIDKDGNPTGAIMTISDTFTFYNAAGAGSPSAPTTVSGAATEFWQGGNDSIYIQNPGANPTGAFEITGLAAGGEYKITFFSARNGATGNRESFLRATGLAVYDSPVLDANANTTNVASFNFFADNTGKVSIELLKGAGNSVNFAYLNALKLEGVPEPASLGLLGLGGLLIARRRRV